jgi:glyoxylase-like metal-dependent hydrolase (beta-lactamase superfamily II)
MKIGRYEIIPIETGRFALDGGAMFGVVPKNLWSRKIPADENNRVELASRALLLKNSDRLVLIDTGIGDKFDDKLSAIYKIDHSQYSIKKSLAEHDIRPESITDVIITHLHFDHVGGATFVEEGNLKLTFPNARHYIQERQWNCANNPCEKDRASFYEEDFRLIEKKEKLNRLRKAGSILPNIETIVVDGHTPGMQLVKIADANKTLLFCSDLIPTASHIPIPWIMSYDNHPMITLEEKRTILQKAVEQEWILFFEHDPTIIWGAARLTDKGYQLDTEQSIDQLI